MDNNSDIIPADIEVSIVSQKTLSSKSSNIKEIDSSSLASLGLSNEFFQQIHQFKMNPGGEGIYKVTFKNGFNGQLSKFKNENAYLGSGISNGKMAQARLTQIPFDPTKLFMGLMLFDLEQKANQLLALGQEILNAVYDVEEAKHKGYAKELESIIEDYHNNWQSSSFISQKLGIIGNIKSESQGGLAFYEKEIRSVINIPVTFVFISKANENVNKLHRFIDGYRLCFYNLAMATYLEALLLKNFETTNLKTIYDRIIELEKAYDTLLTACADWQKRYLSNAIGRNIAPQLNQMDSWLAGKLTKIEKLEYHKIYEGDAEKYVPPEEQKERLAARMDSGISPISSSLKEIDDLHNHEQTIYINKNDDIFIADNVIVSPENQ